MNFDHELVGAFVEYERQYHSRSVREFAAKVNVDPSTIYRLFAGSPSTRPDALRRIEAVLELPERTLDHVRTHDIEELRRSGVPARPMRWLAERIETEEADPGVTRNHGGL